MSAHNLVSQLEEATVSTSGTSGRVLEWRHAAPAGGESGYAKGALWINTAATTTTTRIYINTGSNTSASWANFTTSA
jgi:hypothetical protein